MWWCCMIQSTESFSWVVRRWVRNGTEDTLGTWLVAAEYELGTDTHFWWPQLYLGMEKFKEIPTGSRSRFSPIAIGKRAASSGEKWPQYQMKQKSSALPVAYIQLYIFSELDVSHIILFFQSKEWVWRFNWRPPHTNPIGGLHRLATHTHAHSQARISLGHALHRTMLS